MSEKIFFSDPTNEMLVVEFVWENENLPLQNLPASFTGKKLETILLPDKKIMVIGLGKKEEFNEDYYRRAAGKAVKAASYYKIDSVYFDLKDITERNCLLLFEGASLANYAFDKYKSEETKFFRIKKIVFPKNAENFKDALNTSALVCGNAKFVRDLVNENSNIVNPDFLEKTAEKIAKDNKLKISVLKKKELEKLGMNCILEVGKASTTSPRLIILEYYGNKSSKDKVLFVGKGICFDSGGLDIKPRESMLEMRSDMAGAATVMALLKTAAEIKIKKNIVGIMAVTENLVDANSYRPKDIIKSYSGKTIENLDTDAEGRLILADALNYGVKNFNPNLVLEFSTLTGSVVGTFGQHCAGMFANSQANDFKTKLFESGLNTYERVWELPLFEEYIDETIGERSDFRSLGKTRYNGAIFGGAFLSQFVEKKPFIHLDIAGTAFIDEAKDYLPKDATGFGVRLIIDFLKKI
ncbi:MAG: leucyl aminopeptidase [Candidatus Diapherotrites archaeon]